MDFVFSELVACDGDIKSRMHATFFSVIIIEPLNLNEFHYEHVVLLGILEVHCILGFIFLSSSGLVCKMQKLGLEV